MAPTRSTARRRGILQAEFLQRGAEIPQRPRAASPAAGKKRRMATSSTSRRPICSAGATSRSRRARRARLRHRRLPRARSIISTWPTARTGMSPAPAGPAGRARAKAYAFDPVEGWTDEQHKPFPRHPGLHLVRADDRPRASSTGWSSRACRPSPKPAGPNGTRKSWERFSALAGLMPILYGYWAD